MIDKTVLDFLSQNKISVLTTLLSNNQPHSAALHFANSDDLNFYFLTEKDTRKLQDLADGKEKPGSLVVGFDSEEMITLQLEGKVKILSGSQLEAGWEVYLRKSPKAEGRKSDSNFILVGFTPNWWRYTELKHDPWLIISSE